MTQRDRPAFAELLLGLGETYGETLSDARMEIYFAALKDLPLSELRAAATAHVKTQKFFPRPSELRDALRGRVEDDAELAWLDLLRLVRRVGCYGTPEWPTEALRRAAMDLYGSWKGLCERLPSEGPEFLGAAKLFKSAYVAYARREELVAALPPSKEEAKTHMRALKSELEKRGLPTGDL